jgi:hypothetical protein
MTLPRRRTRRRIPSRFQSMDVHSENPEFLPYGGTLAFGSRPIGREIKHVYGLLKANFERRNRVSEPSCARISTRVVLVPRVESDAVVSGRRHHQRRVYQPMIKFQGFDEDADEGKDVTQEIFEGGHAVCSDYVQVAGACV